MKQLNELKDTKREITLPNGKKTVYDHYGATWCWENAPTALVLELTDQLVAAMFDSFLLMHGDESMQAADVQSAPTDVKELVKNTLGKHPNCTSVGRCYNDLTYGFYMLGNTPDGNISLTEVKTSAESCTNDLSSSTFTVDSETTIPFGKDTETVFKDDDLYYLYEVTDFSFKFLASKTVRKDDVDYVRGFTIESVLAELGLPEDYWS